MALTKADIKKEYPLPVYNYRVTIADDSEAPAVSFTEVSGLTLEHEPVTYRHGLSFVMGSTFIPGMRQPVRITLRKGIVRGNDFLHHWIDKTYNDPFSDRRKRDILIDLCDEAGVAVVRWTVRKALPVKLEAPGFDANGNDAAIETMELIADALTVDYNP